MSRKKSHRQAVKGTSAQVSDEVVADALVADEAVAEMLADATDDVVATEVEVVADEPAGGRKKSKRRHAEEAVADTSSNNAAADEMLADATDVVANVEVVADEPVGGRKKSKRRQAVDAADAELDGVVADADGMLVAEASADEMLTDDVAAVADAPDGDDVVGAPITDEAGVEAALVPGGLSAVQLRHLVEALIFATDKPVTLQRLRQLTRVSDVARIEHALAELQEDYKDRGIALHQVSGGYQFRTNTVFSSWVQQLIAGRPVRLSRAQLETLAIVAYRQPITRPEIDEIRGVDSSGTVHLLLDRALIRVLGKREEVGRPTLYGTTKEFLDFFSLSDLRELPTLREYSELTAESRQVMSDRLGVPLDANGELEPEAEVVEQEPIDDAALVDSILAEHAAAEARFDASAIAEAAMSGGSSFGDALGDDDSMSLSGEMASYGSKLPASEARTYVDAIRAAIVVEIDDVEVSAEMVSGDVDHVEALAEASAHVGHEDEHETSSDASDVGYIGTAANEIPVVETSSDDSMSSEIPHVETSSGDSMTEIPVETSAHVGHDVEIPHVETSSDDSEIPHEKTSAHVGDEDETSAYVGHEVEVPHVETSSDASTEIPHMETSTHLGHDVEIPHVETSAHVGHENEIPHVEASSDATMASALGFIETSADEVEIPHVETSSDDSMSSEIPNVETSAHVAHDDEHELDDSDDPESTGN